MLISQEQLAVLKRADNAIVLGIIASDGTLMLKLSDARAFPGHPEWLEREPKLGAIRGFSLLVRGGEVWALFPRSSLNPMSDWRLEADYIEQLLRVLPTVENVQILE